MITVDRYVKLTLNLLSLSLALIGSIIISVGVILHLRYKDDNYLLNYLIKAFSISYYLFGSFAILFSLFGFIGVFKKNFILLTFFLIYLSVLSIGMLTSGMFIFIVKSNRNFLYKISINIKEDISLYNEAKANNYDTYFNYDGNDDDSKKNQLDAHTLNINQLQLNYKCCGNDSYHDWNVSTSLNDLKPYFVQSFLLKAKQIPFNVPDTCCINSTQPNCGKDFVMGDLINKEGCFYKLRTELSFLANYLFSFSVIIFFSCIFSIAFIIFIASYIENEYSFKEMFKLEDKIESEKTDEDRSESLDSLMGSQPDSSYYDSSEFGSRLTSESASLS